MKKTIILLTFIGILISCSTDENNNSETTELIGQWKLIEQLADPGDGSGTFQSIDSQKVIKFFKNEVITSENGSLCQPYSDEQISSGTYSLSEKRIITNCQNANIAAIGFEIKDNYLLLHFASNEGFSQKFEKIK
ncbi:lipocalin family protein [Aquimarina megaterium]|uniref:lipocalin family protein n=1 Tax=Aquimarina megaterium TaxID=1443666 RepID=UPI000941F51A|nr:lipocalin family protein [Aquimarina megaterium]